MPHRDDEYHDPDLPGSLVGAFRAWQMLRAEGGHGNPQQFAFTFSCPSASVAHEVSAFLHGGTMQEVTTRGPRNGGVYPEWHVGGATRRQIQSLENLERLSTWLRSVGQRHRAPLIQLALRP